MRGEAVPSGRSEPRRHGRPSVWKKAQVLGRGCRAWLVVCGIAFAGGSSVAPVGRGGVRFTQRRGAPGGSHQAWHCSRGCEGGRVHACTPQGAPQGLLAPAFSSAARFLAARLASNSATMRSSSGPAPTASSSCGDGCWRAGEGEGEGRPISRPAGPAPRRPSCRPALAAGRHHTPPAFNTHAPAAPGTCQRARPRTCRCGAAGAPAQCASWRAGRQWGQPGSGGAPGRRAQTCPAGWVGGWVGARGGEQASARRSPTVRVLRGISAAPPPSHPPAHPPTTTDPHPPTPTNAHVGDAKQRDAQPRAKAHAAPHVRAQEAVGTQRHGGQLPRGGAGQGGG